jgi:hypothetical protein
MQCTSAVHLVRRPDPVVFLPPDVRASSSSTPRTIFPRLTRLMQWGENGAPSSPLDPSSASASCCCACCCRGRASSGGPAAALPLALPLCHWRCHSATATDCTCCLFTFSMSFTGCDNFGCYPTEEDDVVVRIAAPDTCGAYIARSTSSQVAAVRNLESTPIPIGVDSSYAVCA